MIKHYLPASIRRFLATPAGLSTLEVALWLPMVVLVAGIATMA